MVPYNLCIYLILYLLNIYKQKKLKTVLIIKIYQVNALFDSHYEKNFNLQNYAKTKFKKHIT